MTKTEQGTWDYLQKHFGYSDEEMKVFKENPRNADVLSKSAALMNKTIVLEVVESTGCNSQHTGYAVFELDPREYHYNPFSTVHGGILSILLDTAMTASVLSKLPREVTCATVEIKVNFIKPVTEKTGLIKCDAHPIHVGKRLATVEGRIRDKSGAILAHAVSTCSIFKVKRA